MQLNHRLAEISDLESVYHLYMDETANPFLTFDPMSLAEFSPVYHSMLTANNIFVVESGQQIIATYRLIQKTHRQSHVGYLGGFTVKTTHKGQGLGFTILDHIKRTAATRSLKRIELTVDTENKAAINLYRKVGFEIEGKLKNNYRLASTGRYHDEYLMALLIA